METTETKSSGTKLSLSSVFDFYNEMKMRSRNFTYVMLGFVI